MKLSFLTMLRGVGGGLAYKNLRRSSAARRCACLKNVLVLVNCDMCGLSLEPFNLEKICMCCVFSVDPNFTDFSCRAWLKRMVVRGARGSGGGVGGLAGLGRVNLLLIRLGEMRIISWISLRSGVESSLMVIVLLLVEAALV